MPNDKKSLETDFLQLARIALAGRAQDIHVLLHRTARRYRAEASDFADAITSLLREAPTRASPLRRQVETPLPVDTESRLHLLRVEQTPALEHDPVLAPNVSTSLGLLIKERKQPDQLHAVNLEPTKTALFIGPPGVGKTMAARWLARELSKPLIVLDLAAVMSSYLGRTGNNLRQVLEYAKSIDCVLLLDELDAIAKRRDDHAEIGELKRLVTVLIQQIDDWPSSGLLIAATNHPDLLDPAIWRRFEAMIDFPLPDETTIKAFVSERLAPYLPNVSVWAGILAIAFKRKSFSQIETELSAQRRAAAVTGASLEERLGALIQPDSLSKTERIELATSLVDAGVVSQRGAQQLTGVSRDTIRDHAKKSSAERKRRLSAP